MDERLEEFKQRLAALCNEYGVYLRGWDNGDVIVESNEGGEPVEARDFV